MSAKRVLLVVLALVVLATVVSSPASAGADRRYKASHPWIKSWSKTDRSIWPSINRAARIFRADAGLMRTIVNGEGGNINPRTLAASLCRTYGKGWNTSGNPPSAAFGAFQFMLRYRGACTNQSAWGTFGTWDDEAFRAAKQLGHPVPARFRTPASNAGQAIVAAYMLANPSRTGGASHWCASLGC